MEYHISTFGQLDGRAVDLITIKNRAGIELSVTNYGCIVTSLIVPGRDGQKDDVVLGYKSLDNYLEGHPFFGAIAGRFANRIKDGRFSLDGKSFQLETNEAPTGQHLHGGAKGFDKFVWGYDVEETEQGVMIHLHRVSVDGEAGYPGTMDVVHTIGLDEDNQLHYNFRAHTDKPTIINLVNHSYYNIAGHDKGSVSRQKLQVFADHYTPVGEDMIPTGAILPVADTGLDFRLETQHFPDSPNQSRFPSVRLNPGEVYEQKTIHRFTVC